MNILKTARSLNSAELASVVVNLLGFFGLLVCVLLSPSSPVYDEVYHLQLVDLLDQYGLSYRFLRGTGQSAPGPLYPIIHYLFQPLTHLQAPAIRLINPLLLLLIIVILTLTLQRFFQSQRGWIASLTILGAPMIWIIAGMALTEIPAMLFATLGIFLLFLALEKNKYRLNQSLGIAAISGLCLGLAITGRQTFIVILLTLPLLTISSPKKYWKPILVCFLTSLIFPAIVFGVWEGLVPPGQRSLGSGYSLVNGLLSFSYAGILFFIFAPRWFSLKKQIAISIFASIVVFNLLFRVIYLAPAYHVFKKIIPEHLLVTFFSIASSFLIAFGILFIISSLKNCRDNYRDNKFLFLTITVLLICATTFKITHYYSTRYTAIAIPFMILSANYYSRENSFKVSRLLAGNILGYLMLVSYFLRSWS